MNDFHEQPASREPGGRFVTLLVPVRGLSGEVYPPGTEIWVPSHRPSYEGSVDGFLRGDWIPMRWFEFSTGVTGAE